MTNTLDSGTTVDHCAKDSFSFSKEIKKVSSTNKFLISYDVCSLFASIPLKETINFKITRCTLRSDTTFGNWKPFKNDEKGFLSHVKSSFCSQDI